MRRFLTISFAVVLVAVACVAYNALTDHKVFSGPPCRAIADNIEYGLDLEQAQNATTIAAIGKKLGVPDHGVTIALATALQESGLRNLDSGHLDSIGLFQQRPSQGWGTVAQIMDPKYSATAFYTRLTKVSGWNDMSVTQAAQAVQKSAAPEAYAQWEAQSRVFAQALTGQTRASFYCHVDIKTSTTSTSQISKDMTAEIGAADFGKTVKEPRGWLVSTWLIGHAQAYGIQSVAFAGKRWTAESGKWSDHSPNKSVVEINK